MLNTVEKDNPAYLTDERKNLIYKEVLDQGIASRDKKTDSREEVTDYDNFWSLLKVVIIIVLALLVMGVFRKNITGQDGKISIPLAGLLLLVLIVVLASMANITGTLTSEDLKGIYSSVINQIKN